MRQLSAGLAALRAGLAAGLSFVEARSELLALEWAEERRRLFDALWGLALAVAAVELVAFWQGLEVESLRDTILAQENILRDYAMERLGAMNSLRIFGTAKNKGAIVSFEMKGAHAHDVATVIDRAGVAVRAGTHCTQPLLQRFGVTATCRASFAMYNTLEEVDVLAEALISARRIFG